MALKLPTDSQRLLLEEGLYNSDSESSINTMLQEHTQNIVVNTAPSLMDLS